MKSRITTEEFSRNFNTLRQKCYKHCYNMKELVSLFKEAGIYHTPRFIKRLIDDGILLAANNIYTFPIRPVYYKRFEKALDWYYETNKEYKKRCLEKQKEKETPAPLNLSQVAPGIFFSSELITAIRVCKENGLKVSLSV